MNMITVSRQNLDVQAIGLLCHVLTLLNGESGIVIYADVMQTIGAKTLAELDEEMVEAAIAYLCGRITLPRVRARISFDKG